MNRIEKLLFTPGSLSTSPSVKQAMLRDMGSRDDAFIQIVAEIREAILKVARVSRLDGYEVIPLQGSGTYGVEAVFSTVVGPKDRVLILSNGAYGKRMVEIASCHGLNYEEYEVPENSIHDVSVVDAMLSRSHFTHVAAVHCETTTGILNPIQTLSATAKKHRCQFIVDAMSSFGGIEIDVDAISIDFLISSSNKCLQGVPGLSFVVARRDSLMTGPMESRSVCLNLRQQLVGMEKNGQFRYTPPTHVVLALHQALIELEAEGGVKGRASRYQENHRVLCNGMQELGFRSYLPPEIQSHIITAFRYPNENFVFEEFYRRLSDRGMLIYPGKLTNVDCFRIGNIGHIFPEDVSELLNAITSVVDVRG